MEENLKRYDAIVWGKDPASIGVRTFVYAVDPREARRQLVEAHGSDKIFSIWNEEDSAKPR
jgi:hypothetical protein